MSWKSSKDHMLRLEAQGKANASHKAWLAKWRAAGSPSTQAGMTKKAPTKTVPTTGRAAAIAAQAAAAKKAAQEAAAKQAAAQKRAAEIQRQKDAAKRAADRAAAIKAQEAADKKAAAKKKAAQEAAAKKAAQEAAAKKAAQEAAAKKAAAQKKAAQETAKPAPAPKPAPKPAPLTGKNVVGADGLTNQERYQKRLADKAAKAAAEKARIAAIDADRPEEVSRYVWEKIKNGDSNFNKTLVTRNPETRDAIVNAGYGEAVKDIHEQAMEEAAAHYVGNGANASDAFNTAQSDWYNQNVGAYTPEAAAAKATAKAEAEAAAKAEAAANPPSSGGGMGAFFNGIRNGSATNIKGNLPAGGTDASVTVNQQPAGNPLGMFNNLMGVVNDVRNPNTTEPIKFTQEEINAELKTRAEAAAAEEAAAQLAAANEAAQNQAALFNPTQEAGPVRNRNFQTVDYGIQGGSTPNVNTGIGVASQSQATPWADAYMRAQQSAAKQGPISGLFNREMENS